MKSKFFPNSTYGSVSRERQFLKRIKVQAKGQLARTTHDQYGATAHLVRSKALDDNSVLGFQVEHEDTIQQTTLNNHIFQAASSE